VRLPDVHSRDLSSHVHADPPACSDLKVLLSTSSGLSAPTQALHILFFPQLRTLSLSDPGTPRASLAILNPDAVPHLDNLSLNQWALLHEKEAALFDNAIQNLAPQLVSFALCSDGFCTIHSDDLFKAWPSFTSLRTLTLTLTLTFSLDLLLILELLPTGLHRLRLLPGVHTSIPLTTILVTARAWPTSISNLKMLAISKVDPGSEERSELLQICEAKGVKVEELTEWRSADYEVWWREDLLLVWSVILCLPE
jgi:hypothetical protein